MGRTNFAPTARTIIVALALMVVGLVCTAGGLVSPQAGIGAYVLAGALLLVGCATRRI